ncbi:hypothetical protein [Phyllobacterium sp. SB3]|uniref:hypothetical protein n=1 Tax=Phyllobacterium sp. SB3 TaxID=3156073 RepID=UPI0032AEC5F7
MRVASTLIILSAIVVAGCTSPTSSVPANSPVKDFSFVPPPKSLTERAKPEKKLTLEESVARRKVETGKQ